MCFALHLPAFNCEKIPLNWISCLWWAEQPDADSPSNFLLFFRFVVCLKLGESLQEVKGDKSGADVDKKDKKMKWKKTQEIRSEPQKVSWQSSKTTAASRQIWNHGDDGDDKHFEGLRLPEKCIWTNLQIQLYKFQNVFEELRLYTEERGLHIIAIPELRNYVNARSFSFWNSVIQCSGYSDILIPLTRIVDKYNG